MAKSKAEQKEQAEIDGTPRAEWARVPRTGESLEGLYRSQLFHLIKTGEVKSASIKTPGASRIGIRLIHVPSLRAWIASHVTEGSQL